MLQSRIHRITLVNMLLMAFALPALAQSEKQKKRAMPVGTPVLWRDPGAIESRNLLLGAGGEAMKPDLRKVTFIEEKTGGYSTEVSSKGCGGK